MANSLARNSFVEDNIIVIDDTPGTSPVPNVENDELIQFQEGNDNEENFSLTKPKNIQISEQKSQNNLTIEPTQKRTFKRALISNEAVPSLPQKKKKKSRLLTTEPETWDCPICFDKWTNTGKHRVSCLACGHLFGLSCIERWVKEKKKCATCQTRAKKSDIRVLFLSKIGVVDTFERDAISKKLEFERDEKIKAEVEKRKLIIQLEAMKQKAIELENKLFEINNKTQYQSNQSILNVTSNTLHTSLSSFSPIITQIVPEQALTNDHLDDSRLKINEHQIQTKLSDFSNSTTIIHDLQLSNTLYQTANPFEYFDHNKISRPVRNLSILGQPNSIQSCETTEKNASTAHQLFHQVESIEVNGARVLALIGKNSTQKGSFFNEPYVILSHVTSAQNLDPKWSALLPSKNRYNHGIRKISLSDIQCSMFVPIHTQPVRDIKFQSDTHSISASDLILTTSFDKTLKVSSLHSCNTVLTYNLKSCGWSCAWHATDPNYLFCALQTGEIELFDMRQTKSQVKTLSDPSMKQPIHSLYHIYDQFKHRNLNSGLGDEHSFVENRSNFSEYFNSDNNDFLLSQNSEVSYTGSEDALLSASTSGCGIWNVQQGILTNSYCPDRVCASLTCEINPPPDTDQLCLLSLRGPSTGQHQAEHHVFRLGVSNGQVEWNLEGCAKGHVSQKYLTRAHVWRSSNLNQNFVPPKGDSVQKISDDSIHDFHEVEYKDFDESQTVNEETTFIASGDETTNQLWLWNMKKESIIQKFDSHEGPIFDIKTFEINEGVNSKTFLGALSEKRFTLYTS